MTSDEYVVDQLLWTQRDLASAKNEKNKLEVENRDLTIKLNRIKELVQSNCSMSGDTLSIHFRNWSFNEDYVRDFNEFVKLIGLDIREETDDESSDIDG